MLTREEAAMNRDPDYLWVSIQVFAGAVGVAIAVGLCRLVIAMVEWWER